jgi:hypothetical protein
MKPITLILQTVGIAVLLSAASASAGSTNAAATTGAGRMFSAVDSIHSVDSLPGGLVSSLPTLWFGLPLLDGNDGRDHDHGWDNDHGRDSDQGRDWDHSRAHDPKHDHDPAPSPAPEPLTALLFGVAMLVGGVILRRQYRRRQS